MRKYMWVIVAIMLGSWLGTAVAAGVSGPFKAEPNRAYRLTFDTLASVTNSDALSNPNGKSERVDCTVVTAGTNVMSVWLQTSANGNAFKNITNASWDITTTNSETKHFFANALGGDQWRLNTKDSDVDVTNTVTMFCDYWR